MKIAIGSDHAGSDLKESLIPFLRDHLAARVEDAGTHAKVSCDFPEFAVKVAEAVVSGEADFGVLICGTGIGMSVAANKIPGIVAALCGNCYSATMAREHNDANILCLGARVVGLGVAESIARAFFTQQPIVDEPRYVRRREQVAALDEHGTGDD